MMSIKERVEKQKEILEAIRGANLPIIPTVVVGFGDGECIFICLGREALREVIRKVKSSNYDYFLVQFEARMKKLEGKEKEYEEFMKNYVYGDLKNDEEAKDVILIFGMDKNGNKVLRIYDTSLNLMTTLDGDFNFDGYIWE